MVNVGVARSGPAAIHLRLVGAFTVEGPTPAPVPVGQGSRLLKVLAAVAGQTVSTPTIVEALWGANPPAGAARNVAALVSRLRKALGRDVILGDSHGYRLVTGPQVTVDLAEAEQLCRVADHELAAKTFGIAELAAGKAEALLTSGQVLADEPDSAWVADARIRAARVLRQARSLRWSAALACSDLPAAIASAEAALHDDPLEEDACRALMTAYWRSSLPGAALSVYERLRNALAEALGIDPAEATQSLYLSILHTEPPPGPATGTPTHRFDPNPAIVGRAGELATLVSFWSEAASGRGGLGLIAAASGMGKRTLVDEVSARVAAAGGLVLRSRCLESERSLFLQPFVDVVRSVLLTRPPAAVRELLGDWAAPLADLIPDIGQILGPVAYERYLPEAHQRRVLSSFAGVLIGLERQSPVLLVVEALEHASDSTLEAVHFLASRVTDHRLLILATVDAADSERVTTALGDVAREIHLGPLDLEAVTSLLQRSRSPLDPRRLLELTAGSPLYLTELIRHGQEFDPAFDGGAEVHVRLPASLRAAITQRLTVVGPEVIELLQLGAIFGDTFTLDEVSSLGQLRVEECAGRVQRALRADLVIAHRASFGFANKILREVLYQSTPEPTQISRHRRAAAILAGQPEAAAAQWAAAGAWREAIDAWRAAAEVAHRALSNSEAQRLLSAAERAAVELGDPTVHTEVLLRRGQIYADLGQYALARDDHEQALAIARELMDDALEARALEQLGWTALYARDALAPGDLADRSTKLAEAAAAAPGAPRTALLLLGGVRHRDGDLAGASAAYAQVISERPDDEIAAQALTFRGAVLQHMDRFTEARTTLAEAVILCRSNGLFRPLLQALFFTALSLGDSGDFSAALRSLQRARRLIDENGTTYYSAGIDTTTSWLLRETGRLDEAREIADRAVESAERGGGGLELEQGLHAFLAVAECELVNGHFDAAGALVESALPFLERPLPYRARAHMRLLEMQARFEPARAEELLLMARANSSVKYESLALWHLGLGERAAELATGLGSDHLIAQVGAPEDARRAIHRLAEALPPEQRDQFMATGRLPMQWRAANDRVG